MKIKCKYCRHFVNNTCKYFGLTVLGAKLEKKTDLKTLE